MNSHTRYNSAVKFSGCKEVGCLILLFILNTKINIMKYILKFLIKLIFYSFIIILVYGVFWSICILWYFELNPSFPKEADYKYEPKDFTFSDSFRGVLSNIKNGML
jgi:hypothetical protein